HPAGLFGRHVSERAADDLRRFRCLALARKAGGNAKPGESNLSAIGHQNVGRLDVLMDEAALMHLAEGRRDAYRETEEGLHLHPRTKKLIERLASRVLEHQDRSAVLLHEFQRPDRPRGVKVLLKLVFACKPIEGGRCWVLRRHHSDKWRPLPIGTGAPRSA